MVCPMSVFRHPPTNLFLVDVESNNDVVSKSVVVPSVIEQVAETRRFGKELISCSNLKFLEGGSLGVSLRF